MAFQSGPPFSDKTANACFLIDGTWHATIMKHFNRLALDCSRQTEKRLTSKKINARYKWRPIKANKLLLWQAVSCLAVWSGRLIHLEKKNFIRLAFRLQQSAASITERTKKKKTLKTNRHQNDLNLQNFSTTYHTKNELFYFTMQQKTFYRVKFVKSQT